MRYLLLISVFIVMSTTVGINYSIPKLKCEKQISIAEREIVKLEEKVELILLERSMKKDSIIIIPEEKKSWLKRIIDKITNNGDTTTQKEIPEDPDNRETEGDSTRLMYN